MRIYAVADVHSRSQRLDRIRQQVDTVSPDVLVVAGDADGHFRRSSILTALDSLGLPVLYVRGNTDKRHNPSFFSRMDRLRSLHLTRLQVKGVNFAGAGGTVLLPFLSLLGFRERRLIEQLMPLIDSETVLVVHPPPRGVLDRVAGKWSAGSFGVRDMVLKRQPRLVVCGHIHESAGVARLGGTTVVNCSMSAAGAGAVIDLDGSAPPRVRLIPA